MKPSTAEWIKKAESDYQAALALSRRCKTPFHDEACFHFQQSAEKYLKACLEEANTRHPKTHDLDKLLSLLLPVEPLWAALLPALLRLNDYAWSSAIRATKPQRRMRKRPGRMRGPCGKKFALPWGSPFDAAGQPASTIGQSHKPSMPPALRKCAKLPVTFRISSRKLKVVVPE